MPIQNYVYELMVGDTQLVASFKVTEEGLINPHSILLTLSLTDHMNIGYEDFMFEVMRALAAKYEDNRNIDPSLFKSQN